MPRNKLFISICVLMLLPFCAFSQKRSEFKESGDSLAVLLKERTGVRSSISLSRVLKRGGKLDLYFSRSLSDYPWRPEDVKWMRRTVQNLFPDTWKKYSLGEIFCGRTNFTQLPVKALSNDGNPRPYTFPGKDHPTGRLVRRAGEPSYSKGLGDKHIAIWQSHGRYFDDKTGEWVWQRPQLWRTVEDMYTQSYVLPFLVPMLERAGACVLTPRERDTQRDEVVADNDPSFERGNSAPEQNAETSASLSDTASVDYTVLPVPANKLAKYRFACAPEAEELRRQGSYSENGKWESIQTGFADKKRYYLLGDNPFTMGTARKTACNSSAAGKSSIVWSAEFPTKGEYAVYVSYVTLPESSGCAHYCVNHLGGRSEFIVNQKMGGGTWIYLGTFEFVGEGSVSLDNGTPAGCKFEKGSVVTADAVRFGGGYGKVRRGSEYADECGYRSSGYPAYAEGALYSEIWYGADTKVYADWETEYVRDYASRGAWVKWLKDDKNVPFDLSLAFHSDAGVTPNDSIIGTLSIYTLMAEGSRKCTDGTDRMSCRLFSDRVQSQIVDDLRRDWNEKWTRRPIWDRSYSESRTTDVPATLLELLSHQNFADMKYGLDPAFRFDVCRSVYKGMLKTISDLYEQPYVVQPLPVRAFSATLSEGRAKLSWLPTEDAKEPTATAKSYIVYTRIDDKGFDSGVRVNRNSFEKKLEPGHIYSFKVEAENEGGRSFPSEILAVGLPESGESADPVLIVNNFTRVSGPTWFDTPTDAGFDASLDGGVPYISDISYIGEVYETRRDRPWDGALNPGFGACGDEYAGRKVAGNTFDFVYEHGKALFSLGRAFCSQSAEAFYTSQDQWRTIDLICGKQVRTSLGSRSYAVFPKAMRKALYRAGNAGSNLLVSGANICTDVWDCIYPQCADSLHRDNEIEFVRDVLGIKRINGFGARDGRVCIPSGEQQLWHAPNEEHYCVERCDAIAPVAPGKSLIAAVYPQDRTSAAVFYSGNGYKAASFGFPLEALKDPQAMKELIKIALDYFDTNN